MEAKGQGVIKDEDGGLCLEWRARNYTLPSFNLMPLEASIGECQQCKPLI